MLPHDHLEYKILGAAALGDRFEGRELDWTALWKEVGNPDAKVLLSLLKDLSARGLLELRKWVGGAGSQTYQNTSLSEEDFFYRASFCMDLTSAGHRRLQELEHIYREEQHIDKALAREKIHLENLQKEVQGSIQDEIGSIPVEPSGGYARKVIGAYVKGLERLMHGSVDERRKSLAYAPELIQPNAVARLRGDLSHCIDNRFTAVERWLQARGFSAAGTGAADPWEDERARLNALASDLLRDLALERQLLQKQPDRHGTQSTEHTVFISCGQYTEAERSLGKALAAAVEELTPYKGYFAENQNSLQGLSQHVFGALNRAAGLVAVMHHRGSVSTPSGSHLRGSVWIEQEIAIAAFLTQAQGREFTVQLYIQKGIKREGAREQLRLNPMEFETDAEVLEHFRRLLQNNEFVFNPTKTS